MTVIDRGFKRGWADAAEGFESSALRFIGDFLTGYFEGYRRGQRGKVEGKTFEAAITEWHNR